MNKIKIVFINICILCTIFISFNAIALEGDNDISIDDEIDILLSLDSIVEEETITKELDKLSENRIQAKNEIVEKTYNELKQIEADKQEKIKAETIKEVKPTVRESRGDDYSVPDKQQPVNGIQNMKVEFSHYTSLPEENGGWTGTASGVPLEFGVVAAASSVIPMGTIFYSPLWNMQFVVADLMHEDYGTINGVPRIDVFMPMYANEDKQTYLNRVMAEGLKYDNITIIKWGDGRVEGGY